MSVTALISNISRASLHDGPGIRTVVYFKGCTLHCRWCHNPETIAKKNEILYAAVKCIHCGRCVRICPENHLLSGNDMIFLRDNCGVCGKCAEVCPSGAITVSGRKMTVAEVMKELLKDIHYYRQNGGITLSGGECLLQPDFCLELLKACKAHDIHTAIETALNVPWDHVEKVVSDCDLFFADFKIPDTQKHKMYTGVGNGMILSNLKKLAETDAKIIVRIPLIPGVNDSDGDIILFANALGVMADRLSGIEVLRYNNLAESKYIISGKRFADFGEPQTDHQLVSFCNRLEAAIAKRTPVYCVL